MLNLNPKVPTTINFEAVIYRKLKEIAAREKRSVSFIVNEILNHELLKDKKQKSAS